MSFTSRLKSAVADAVDAAQTLIATEPVRVRAWLTSAVGGLSVLVPAFANANTAEQVAGVLTVVLPILLGESARSKVTPIVPAAPAEPAPDAPAAEAPEVAVAPTSTE